MPKYGKFRTRILAQEERRRNAPVNANITKNIKPMAKRNMGVEFTTKDGEEVMFRMPPFPQLKEVPEDNKGLSKLPEKVRNNMGFKRYKEDEDTGMLRMEELKPLNRMGTVPLQRNEMPMAYKHKVYKPTAKAKAIPFTNRNAL
tara:strand:- start:34 stop:465 length:432 start_codon:yes stop_codon:yes gene_type:complete